eukprot:gene130-5359_t
MLRRRAVCGKVQAQGAAGCGCAIVSYAKRGSDRPFSLWAAPPPRCVLGGAWEALYERLEV